MPDLTPFNISSPNKVIDIDVTADAVLSFEAVGSIAAGSVQFSTSMDGVVFTPSSFYSFVDGIVKTELSAANRFATEDRGSMDVKDKIKARAASSADFQGNLNVSADVVSRVVVTPVPGTRTLTAIASGDGLATLAVDQTVNAQSSQGFNGKMIITQISEV